MNLADAIRKAAQNSGAPLGQPEHRLPEPIYTPEPALPVEAEVHAAANAGGNVVRLELILTPEQLKGLFGAVVANQHSVLTLREAASYLRASTAALEQLAVDGEVPGMLIDGKWRFTRQGLDGWLSTHSKRKEA